MAKKRKPELELERDQEQEQEREPLGELGGREVVVPPDYSPNPNVHTPFAASADEHRCGIENWLEDNAPEEPPPDPPAGDAEIEIDESALEDITPDQLPGDGNPPRPESPPRRRKIWDNF